MRRNVIIAALVFLAATLMLTPSIVAIVMQLKSDAARTTKVLSTQMDQRNRDLRQAYGETF